MVLKFILHGSCLFLFFTFGSRNFRNLHIVLFGRTLCIWKTQPKFLAVPPSLLLVSSLALINLTIFFATSYTGIMEQANKRAKQPAHVVLSWLGMAGVINLHSFCMFLINLIFLLFFSAPPPYHSTLILSVSLFYCVWNLCGIN